MNRLNVYKTSDDFAKSLGLSEIEKTLIRGKKRLIEKLKNKRIKSKLSQASLAKLLNSKQSVIALMELGQVSQVSMDFLIKATIALNISFVIKSHKVA